MRQRVLKDEIEQVIGHGCITSPWDIAGWQRVVAAFRRLHAGQQYGVIEGGTDLADAAPHIDGRLAVDDDARILIAGCTGAVSDDIIEL